MDGRTISRNEKWTAGPSLEMKNAFLEMETISRDAFQTQNQLLDMGNTFIEMETISRDAFQTKHRFLEMGNASLRRKPSLEMPAPNGSIQPPTHSSPYLSTRYMAVLN